LKEYQKFLLFLAIFLFFYFLPISANIIAESFTEGIILLQEYIREHTLFCLIPAFFIAGAITVFLNKEAIIKYLGPASNKLITYPIASVSGGFLAVCSCTMLPLFAGIYKRGAGIGPATTFLFAGPAINVAAIFLTGTVLGWELSIVRLILSVLGAMLIGLLMNLIFKEQEKDTEEFISLEEDKSGASPVAIAFLILSLLAILIINGLSISITLKYSLFGIFILTTILTCIFGLRRNLIKNWLGESWFFIKLIMPYLFVGIFIAGIIGVIIPEDIVNTFIGGNRLLSNFIASIFGSTMYFATLTEVPIIQKFMSMGMGKGPALALFLSGYTLSLPNIIALFSIIGKKKTFVYIALVVLYSTLTGYLYGNIM
jgi:hypothetical protein